MAAAAAARMNGFAPGPPGGPNSGPSNPGFGPPPHMMGHSPFFRPPFPHPPTDFHTPPHLLPPHPNFLGPHRTPTPGGPFGPRPFMLMHHQQQQNLVQQQIPPNGMLPNLNNVPTSNNCAPGGSNGGFLTNFHQSVVGDLRAGK